MLHKKGEQMKKTKLRWDENVDISLAFSEFVRQLFAHIDGELREEG